MLSLLEVTLAVAGTIAVALLILRAVLSNKEDDQLYLSASETHLEQEQIALHSRLSSLTRYAMIFGGLAIALLLAIASIWTYQQLNRPPID